MTFRERNRRFAIWAAAHPVKYALVVAAFIGAEFLILFGLFDRPITLPFLLIWVVAFPIAISLLHRVRVRSGFRSKDSTTR